MKVYAGITIGPIVEVLCETSTPAALWFGSSVFSDITRRLCLGIKKEWPDARIYSPYFDAASVENYPSDGVGKYHDRVFFSVCGDESNKSFIPEVRDRLRILVENIKADTVNVFPEGIINPGDIEKTKEFLKKYLQIHFAVMSENKAVGENGAKNAILSLSPYLDELELMKSFPATSEQNIFLDFFGRIRQDDTLKDRAAKKKMEDNNPEENAETDSVYSINDYIRNSDIFNAIENKENAFLLHRKFKTLMDIANAKNDLKYKYSHYYAVVSADGDRMGKFLESISTDAVTSFSKGCLKYNEEAAAMVKEYGGMPIYAGGDDLLFIAPVCVKDSKSDKTDAKKYIFDLCKEINDRFRDIIKDVEIFKENPNIPSISFGISIRYYMFPLYEAFEDSRKMLESVKRGINGEEKNSIGISLRKHSGQSLKLFVGNGSDDFNAFKAFFNTKGDNLQVHSLLYNLEAFSALYDKAYKDAVTSVKNSKNSTDNPETGLSPSDFDKIRDSFENIWKNLSDNSEQKKYWSYIKYVADMFFNGFVAKTSRIKSGENGKSDSIKTLESILRLEKFYLEKAGDE